MVNHTEKETISRIIKERRLAKGYSQQELAQLCLLNLRSVQRIEKAEVLPRSYTLKLLAEMLDIDPEELIYRPEIQGSTAEEESFMTKLNLPGKIILTCSTALLFFILAVAYLSQSASFPETTFELFLFIGALLIFYTGIAWKIWA
ncbi:helix-turn-helix domain-containing protein [Pedobacter duraquae]|uniref:Helix-turn-helix protein n=1 Tax=Pedobacter duraquae TaxID=425511 RepID=A0A4R6IPQ2_9SPHI|nr:helix-turn-helix domain-containing protein [Pedobacter duraquae]TDO23925.1 helix-turn-helix protein [Pedobacter duraquae]